jgi:hypothetical protein
MAALTFLLEEQNDADPIGGNAGWHRFSALFRGFLENPRSQKGRVVQ